ncbi:hypothetical protein G6F24_018865 [Rhizopus arrhizus]|nr:hypothetical protein G6F24_018865 [Rhizopus arrhizus]
MARFQPVTSIDCARSAAAPARRANAVWNRGATEPKASPHRIVASSSGVGWPGHSSSASTGRRKPTTAAQTSARR